VFCSEVTGQIRDSFEALAEEVRRRKDTLLAELETTHADRQLSLARQADCLENLLVDVTNCCELTQSALRHGNETEVHRHSTLDVLHKRRNNIPVHNLNKSEVISSQCDLS